MGRLKWLRLGALRGSDASYALETCLGADDAITTERPPLSAGFSMNFDTSWVGAQPSTRPGLFLRERASLSDVEIRDLERVVLDEISARLDHIPHEGREDLVSGNRILDAHPADMA